MNSNRSLLSVEACVSSPIGVGPGQLNGGGICVAPNLRMGRGTGRVRSR